ncbi:PilT/PilU family type 4a pilus ATPase [bacterium]|nr:PilT/PilU family type 4a pilus ATPase [bacterium]
MKLDKFFLKAISQGASDIHFKAGSAPIVRMFGDLYVVKGPPLRTDDITNLVFELLAQAHGKHLRSFTEIDTTYSIPGKARFRVNIYRSRGEYAIAMRYIPLTIPTLEELRVPSVLKLLARRPRGLVLVTGITGSGKTTTLASSIEFINQNRKVHIITIEDPVEFVYSDNRAIIHQREVGIDTPNFITALRAALREDPDVIMVGEMRDMDTIATVLQAAETGHLVFSTFHTTDAKETIARIISYFPESQQQQVRSQIAANVIGIISQRLAKRRDKKGLVLAAEVLINTPTIRSAILENRIAEIPMLISKGAEEYSMQTFDQAAVKLFKEGLITEEVGRATATNPSEFDRSIKFTR